MRGSTALPWHELNSPPPEFPRFGGGEGASGGDDPAMAVARVRYALSRRTDLYAVAAWARADDHARVSLSRDEPGYGSRQRSLVLGIQHRF